MADFWVTEAMNGFGMTVQVEEELCRRQTKFQKLELYRTKKLGKLLLLDGIIQLTNFDEFAYHEMMAHLPMFAHENPRRALVIGGGDGGVLRELGRHPQLESIDICEIDAEVIEVAREFLPELACGFGRSQGPDPHCRRQRICPRLPGVLRCDRGRFDRSGRSGNPAVRRGVLPRHEAGAASWRRDRHPGGISLSAA